MYIDYNALRNGRTSIANRANVNFMWVFLEIISRGSFINYEEVELNVLKNEKIFALDVVFV